MMTNIEKQTELSCIELIKAADARLEGHFASKLQINRDLRRTLVSFQANKNAPGFRWFKYKEGFSSALVNYVFDRCNVTKGEIIDPFAGSGATLFVASRRGLDSTRFTKSSAADSCTACSDKVSRCQALCEGRLRLTYSPDRMQR